MGQINV